MLYFPSGVIFSINIALRNNVILPCLYFETRRIVYSTEVAGNIHFLVSLEISYQCIVVASNIVW